MSAEQLAMRLLADASGVSSDRLRKGEIDASEFGRIRDAALEIQDSPLYIDATGGISISKLTARARRLKRQVGLDLIIVDYLQLVTASDNKKGEGRVQEVSEITMGLKSLAKELAVPVIALSQLSRQVESREDKRPQLSDLRESGSIEQDADAVMFVYRESYYKGRAAGAPRLAGRDGHHPPRRRGYHRQAAPRPHRHGEAVLQRRPYKIRESRPRPPLSEPHHRQRIARPYPPPKNLSHNGRVPSKGEAMITP